MNNRFEAWARLLLGGMLLFAANGATCVADALRDASDDLADLANDINDDRSDAEKFFDELGDLFD